MSDDAEHPSATGGSEPDDTEPTPANRRTMLKRIGVGAAVVWTVPAITTAKALAAASGGPAPCPICGPNLIVNFNADDNPQAPPPADTAPWFLDIPLGVFHVAQYDPQTFPAPIPAADPFYFRIDLAVDEPISVARQDIASPAACVGKNVTFSSFAAATNNGTIVPEVCFYDDNGFNIDHVDASVPPTPISSATMVPYSGGPFPIPPGTATIAMQFNVENPDDVAMSAMFDFVDLTILC